MVFSGKRQTLIDGIILNGTILEQVTQSPFLGIIVDDILSWKPHIQATTRKLAKCIGMLYKINKKFSKTIMLQLYNSFVLPYIQYGITLWGASPKTSLESIFVLQKKALKIALSLPRRTSTQQLFHDSRACPLHDQYKLSVSIFMFKLKQSLLPTCFNHYFQTNSDLHSHRTRSAGFYRLPLYSTNYCQQSILFQGPKIWSNLPLDIRQSDSVNSFKRKMKVYLADQRGSSM